MYTTLHHGNEIIRSLGHIHVARGFWTPGLRALVYEQGSTVKRVLQKVFGGNLVRRFYTIIPSTGIPSTGIPSTGIPGTGIPGTGIPGTGHRRSGSNLAEQFIADELYSYEPMEFETIYTSSTGQVCVESGPAVRRADGRRVELIFQQHVDGEVLVIERLNEDPSSTASP